MTLNGESFKYSSGAQRNTWSFGYNIGARPSMRRHHQVSVWWNWRQAASHQRPPRTWCQCPNTTGREARPVKTAEAQQPWMGLASSQDLATNSTRVQGWLLLSYPCSLGRWELPKWSPGLSEGSRVPPNILLLLSHSPSTLTLLTTLPSQQMMTILFLETVECDLNTSLTPINCHVQCADKKAER